MKNTSLIVFIMLGLLSCKKYEDLPTVEKLDIQRYMGTWYEIARLPNKFEKGLECVTATYSIKDKGKIKVVNRGHSIEDNTKVETATGTAWVPDDDHPGRLKVTFFWPFAGKYYVIMLDKEYNYALVGDPSRKYLWILSKTKEPDESVIESLLGRAKELKFDTSKVIRINQSCS
jgi:apolipoprotein D and lipocalin family protein